MYPLKTLLIGCTDDVLGDLRRELTNLSVVIEGEYLDVRSCLNYVLANPADKRLLVYYVNSSADVVQLERLNDLVVGEPILALVDPVSDPSLMVRAMRAGAAQVVRRPLQADDFRGAMNRIAIQFGNPPNQCQVITVFGVTGGSGATSISLNLAAEIGRLRNSPCLLVEGAVGFGRLANYLGITPQATIYDLIKDIDHVDVERVRQAITKVDANLHVITGSHSGIVPLELTTENVLRLLNYAKQLDDVIVVDGRHEFEELDLDLVTHSRQVVLVAQPSVPSIAGLSKVLDLLAQRQCLAEQYVVINRYLRNEKEFSIHSLEKLLHTPKVFPVANDWDHFRAAESAGITLRNVAPHGSALADITALASAILGMPAGPPHAGWSFLNSWNRFTQAFVVK